MSTTAPPRPTGPGRRDFSRLLAPRSIAVLGGRWAERVVKRCLATGFRGNLWPVTPTRTEMCGLPTFPDLAALPAAPDAAFVAVNRHESVRVIGDLAAMGAGGAVCFASGFAETGPDGKALQDRLSAAAGPMPFLGPNCYGLINYIDNALLWPDEHGGAPLERGVALLLQSGNIACNVTMNRRSLPIAYVCAMGNQANVAMPDMIEALAETGRVTAIGLLMEGLGDPTRLSEATAAAHRLGVPVIALKAGRSAAGSDIAMTHTGSMAGSDDVMDLLLERIGIARVDNLAVYLEAMKLLHVFGPLPANRICTMSCSGGEALLVADAARHHDVQVADFTPEDHARIRPTLHDLVHLGNPFDYHTFDWGDRTRLEATFTAVMRSSFDMTALINDPPRRDRCDPADWDVATEAFAAAAATTGARAAVIATLGESIPELQGAALLARGIAPLIDIDAALAAIAIAAKAGRERPPYSPLGARATAGHDPDASGRPLDEPASKTALAEFGLPVPSSRVCRTQSEAVAAALDIGFPVALKVVGAEFLHKTEIGGVRLGLGDEASVRGSAADLLALSDRILVERMAPRPVAELIVGVNRDPIAGLVLLLGAGGVFAELLNDKTLLLLPTTREEISAGLARLRISRLLEGWRGGARGDTEAAIDAILAVARYAEANASSLVAIDVNPLMVLPEGRGALAVDAVVIHDREPTATRT
ncbi:MAG: CoA-binding protein [Rhizobiales bacterium]|nr:CoA-binding protein [Hyphomicrobiales bacterium]